MTARRAKAKIVQIMPEPDDVEVNRFPARSHFIMAWALLSDGRVVGLTRTHENSAELVPVPEEGS